MEKPSGFTVLQILMTAAMVAMEMKENGLDREEAIICSKVATMLLEKPIPPGATVKDISDLGREHASITYQFVKDELIKLAAVREAAKSKAQPS